MSKTPTKQQLIETIRDLEDEIAYLNRFNGLLSDSLRSLTEKITDLQNKNNELNNERINNDRPENKIKNIFLEGTREKHKRNYTNNRH